MVSHWRFINTFSSKILYKNNFKIVNEKIMNNEFHHLDNHTNKILFSNIEMIKITNARFSSNKYKGYLDINQNDWKYPFPNNFIPKYYDFIRLKMEMEYKNSMYLIEEEVKTNIHEPGPYSILCKYKLKINNNFIESKKIKGEMLFSTLNTKIISNNEANNLLFCLIQNEN